MPSLLEQALQRLRDGDVVAVPTETVYGLAADATNTGGVAKIFALKGRPSTNPLIVHVASVEVARRYVAWDDRATTLFAQFAPGPLTVVLKRAPDVDPGPSTVVSAVSAGRDTIAIRIPAHPLTLDLLKLFDGALAAPSANRSNHVSPTTADHVRADFGDSVFILDGGPCEVGIESTVLDLTTVPRPTILRPGDVTESQLEAIVGPVDCFVGHVDRTTAAASPGQSARHYAPRAPARRFVRERGSSRVVARSALLCVGAAPDWIDRRSLLGIVELSPDPREAAVQFYDALRRLDELSPAELLVELPPATPEWAALRDRAARATRSPTL